MRAEPQVQGRLAFKPVHLNAHVDKAQRASAPRTTGPILAVGAKRSAAAIEAPTTSGPQPDADALRQFSKPRRNACAAAETRSAKKGALPTSVPAWWDARAGRGRIRARLHAAALSSGFTEAPGPASAHWDRVLNAVPVASLEGARSAPCVQPNCSSSLVAVYRPRSQHVLVTPECSLFDRRPGEGATSPPMVRLNTAQSVAAASWSAAKEDKLAICSGASSDVTVWNASTGRNDMTLACGQRVDPGQRGLLAIQTLKDSAFMLAAGGRNGVVYLWDARASKTPSVSLRAPSADTVTALHVCPRGQHLLAGTAAGDLHTWDLRALQTRRPQVFGARGASSGGCAVTRSAAAALMVHPTALPASVQLRLCLSTFRGLFTGPALSAPEMVRYVPDCLTQMGAASLCAKPAVGSYPSGIAQLLSDPAQPSRVAFALASGAAGVVDMGTSKVTHSFNPSVLQSKDVHRALVRHEDAMSLAWAPDGRVLHYLHPHHHFLSPAHSSWCKVPDGSDDVGAPGGALASRGPTTAEAPGSEPINEGALQNDVLRIVPHPQSHDWADADLLDAAGEEAAGCKVVYALDATASSPLHCSSAAAAAAAELDAGKGPAVGLQWHVRRDCGDGCVQVCLHGTFAESAIEQCPQSRGFGAIAEPLQGGVTAAATGCTAQAACSLVRDERRSMMYLCGAAGLLRARMY